ncbi:unnamed protein product [Mytilus edulis]|uniref:Uncharacterized protein n=1 Tax=Mytilus edulis TaxID=6550 RepID=A0A8S3UDY7_MYTED|nr:unnamed protein product [Mytilus edulis]
MYGLSGRRCIPQEIMCDGYRDCSNGVDERRCGNYDKTCKVIYHHGYLECHFSRMIEVDDAWFDNKSLCVRNGVKQSFHSIASNLCNNKHRCLLGNNETHSVKVLYHCKDKHSEPTRKTSTLFSSNTPTHTKLISRKTFNMHSNRTLKSISIITLPSHEHGEEVKQVVFTYPTSSSSTLEIATSVKIHAQASPKHTAKMNITTNNKINNPFGYTKTMRTDTISTLNNNQRPTHMMHINMTLLKHDLNIDNEENKSQVALIAGSVTGVIFVICIVVLLVAVRRNIIKRTTNKGKERTTVSTSNTQSRKFSNSFEGPNNIPLYSCVNNLIKSEFGKPMPQSKSISNVEYMEACDFSVQNGDYDHIERVGRRADVDMVYSLTTYQKTEDDYDISGNLIESLRSYQENSIYD